MSSSYQIIQECTNATQANIERAIKSFSYLSENQFNWKPDPESWSIRECLSHLVNSNRLYLNKIENILTSNSSSTEKDFLYRQSFIGKMITKGIDPAYVRKSKTFKVFFPDANVISKSIINDYVNSSKKLIYLADKMKHLDLKKIKLSSPVNKLIRLNLGDPLIIISKHDERHLNQAERLMSQKEFPTR
jgi:DinB superfamily